MIESGAVENAQEAEEEETFHHLIKNALGNASAHGLPNIDRSESIPRKSFWTILFFAGLSLFLWQCCGIISAYQQRNVDTNIELKYSKELNFPAVTICNLNPIKLSLLGDISSLNNLVGSATTQSSGTAQATQSSGLDTVDKSSATAEQILATAHMAQVEIANPITVRKSQQPTTASNGIKHPPTPEDNSVDSWDHSDGTTVSHNNLPVTATSQGNIPSISSSTSIASKDNIITSTSGSPASGPGPPGSPGGISTDSFVTTKKNNPVIVTSQGSFPSISSSTSIASEGNMVTSTAGTPASGAGPPGGFGGDGGISTNNFITTNKNNPVMATSEIHVQGSASAANSGDGIADKDNLITSTAGSPVPGGGPTGGPIGNGGPGGDGNQDGPPRGRKRRRRSDEIPTTSGQMFSVISDLGGQIGLWLGVSMITVFEFVELLFDVSKVIFFKLKKGRKQGRATSPAPPENNYPMNYYKQKLTPMDPIERSDSGVSGTYYSGQFE